MSYFHVVCFPKFIYSVYGDILMHKESRNHFHNAFSDLVCIDLWSTHDIDHNSAALDCSNNQTAVADSLDQIVC